MPIGEDVEIIPLSKSDSSGITAETTVWPLPAGRRCTWTRSRRIVRNAIQVDSNSRLASSSIAYVRYEILTFLGPLYSRSRADLPVRAPRISFGSPPQLALERGDFVVETLQDPILHVKPM